MVIFLQNRQHWKAQAKGGNWAPVLLRRWRLGLTGAAGLVVRCVVGQVPGLYASAAAALPTAVRAAAGAVNRQPPALVQRGRLGLQLLLQCVDFCLKFGHAHDAIGHLLCVTSQALSRAAESK